MESIEERAEKYVNQVVSELDPQFKYDDGDFHFYDTNLEEAYIQGATEQKAIDDAKYKKLRDLAYAMYTNAQYLTNDASGLRQSMRSFYHYINFEED